MATTSDFKPGMMIEIDGELYRIVEYQHVKPGKGGALYKTKIRNLKSGSISDKTFRAGERINKPFVETRKLEYIYNSGGMYYFMDENTYEEVILESTVVGEKGKFMKENTHVSVLTAGGRIIDIELPAAVSLKVAKTEPGLKGDTVSGAVKQAVLETGMKLQVPLFVNEGDEVKVDTRSGEYLGRA
jgi:elongation factor P